MAPTPEINLPASSELGVTDSYEGPGIASIFPRSAPSDSAGDQGTSEKPASDDDTREDLDEKELDVLQDEPRDYMEKQDIVWRYLTFETELPHPASIHPSDPAQQPPPECPSLVKYTNPFDWSRSRKNFTIWTSCIGTALTAVAAGSYAPGAGQMSEEWHVSRVAVLVGVTMFTTGFAVAPMVLAPFSEINGRRPMFVVSGIIFVICQLCSGLTKSYAGMIVVRFLVGVGGSTFSTMVGGVVSDIYRTEDRNTPMALFSGGALCGTGIGPLAFGYVAQNLNWRWIFYIQTIACALMVAVIIVGFKEPRGSVRLSRKAKALNKWYEAREEAGYYGFVVPSEQKPGVKVVERIRWKVRSDEERASLKTMITVSLVRPFHLLFTEPVVFFFSLWVAFSWGVLYLSIAAVPLVMQTNHDFTLGQANAVFAAMVVGTIIATIASIYQEKIARKRGTLVDSPEGRLYFACVQSACLPIGLFMFGWTSFRSIHWIAPTIALCLSTIGIFAIYLAVFNYLADTYHRYASSALAAQSFCRNILGGSFILFTNAMYNKLGFGPASSLLGGIATILTLVPWVLVFYGPRIRARSKFAMGLTES